MTEEEIFLEYLKIEEKYKYYKPDISFDMLLSWLKEIEIPGIKILFLEYLSNIDRTEFKLILKELSPLKNYNKRYLTTEEHPLYKEILNIYNEINQRIADTINKAENITPSIVAGIYYTILKEGYLSIDHKFVGENSSIDNNISLPNLGIINITGQGVCRNISTQFQDILNIYNIKNSLLYLEINPHHSKIKTIGKESQIRTFNDPLNTTPNLKFLKNRIMGNHVINIVEDNNKSLLLDLSNKTCYKKKNNNQIDTYINNTKEPLANIKYYTNYLFEPKHDSKILKSILEKPNTSLNKIDYEFQQGEIFVKENTSLFETLYQKNIDQYKEIMIYLEQLNQVITPYLRYSEKTREEIRKRVLKP